MNEYYMSLASLMALKNAHNNFRDGGPFGAVIVKDGKVLAKASNRVLKDNDPTAHAEVCAIRKACKKLKTFDLSGCILYTSCYPCPMCLSAIMWSNIKEVYYGNTALDADKIGFKDNDIYEVLSGKEKMPISFNKIDNLDAIKAFDLYNKDHFKSY